MHSIIRRACEINLNPERVERYAIIDVLNGDYQLYSAQEIKCGFIHEAAKKTPFLPIVCLLNQPKAKALDRFCESKGCGELYRRECAHDGMLSPVVKNHEVFLHFFPDYTCPTRMPGSPETSDEIAPKGLQNFPDTVDQTWLAWLDEYGLDLDQKARFLGYGSVGTGFDPKIREQLEELRLLFGPTDLSEVSLEEHLECFMPKGWRIVGPDLSDLGSSMIHNIKARDFENTDGRSFVKAFLKCGSYNKARLINCLTEVLYIDKELQLESRSRVVSYILENCPFARRDGQGLFNSVPREILGVILNLTRCSAKINTERLCEDLHRILPNETRLNESDLWSAIDEEDFMYRLTDHLAVNSAYLLKCDRWVRGFGWGGLYDVTYLFDKVVTTSALSEITVPALFEGIFSVFENFEGSGHFFNSDMLLEKVKEALLQVKGAPNTITLLTQFFFNELVEVEIQGPSLSYHYDLPEDEFRHLADEYYHFGKTQTSLQKTVNEMINACPLDSALSDNFNGSKGAKPAEIVAFERNISTVELKRLYFNIEDDFLRIFSMLNVATPLSECYPKKARSEVWTAYLNHLNPSVCMKTRLADVVEVITEVLDGNNKKRARGSGKIVIKDRLAALKVFSNEIFWNVRFNKFLNYSFRELLEEYGCQY